MDHEDKESKTYIFKVKKYDSGTPEEFLRWRLILNEQMKNHGYNANYYMVMNLAQAMLVGHSLEAFLNERRAQEAKNKTRKAKDQAVYAPPPHQFLIAQFLNWQSVLLTSKVDGEMPMRGRDNI
jgi:hypothetical protein